MRYPGSKRRMLKPLEEVIRYYKGDRSVYIEPFVGGANSFTRMVPLFEKSIGIDNNADLIALYHAVLRGWEPPTLDITPLYYEHRRTSPKRDDPERGFVGVGASYGGKWWGGHAHGGYNADGTPRNHAAESWRALRGQASVWAQHRVGFRAGSYESITELWPGTFRHCVVYCDPPYVGDMGHAPYPYSTHPFDHAAYYEWLERLVALNALVICSERMMPEPWVPVWAQGVHGSLRAADLRESMSEVIWVHKSQML